MSKQVAVLLIFPEGVKKEDARQETAKLCALAQRGGLQAPHVAGVQEFNPEYGGVVIYQP